jgi:hypothetical protein
MRDNLVSDSSRLGTVGEPEEVLCSAMEGSFILLAESVLRAGSLVPQTQKKDTP